MTRLKREKKLPGKTSADVRFGTPFEVAEARATRLCEGVETVIEVGAGAGFQTASFASRAARVIAVDIDAQRLSRASFAENVVAIPGDALDPSVFEKIKGLVRGKAIVFLDPQRAPNAKERTIDEIQPNIGRFVELYSRITPDIAIELPPFLSQVPFACEREYLSVDGELNRLTIYMGNLRRCSVSVLALPSGERLEHDATQPELTPRHVKPLYILEPDRALERAGLTPLVLPSPYDVLALGKRQVYLVERAPAAWFEVYEILGSAPREKVGALLERYGCGTVILHGSMGQEEQRATLRELGRFCHGIERLHIFTGDMWHISRVAN